MKSPFLSRLYLLFISVLLFSYSTAVYGQLSGSKLIPGNYATIGAAIADLNISGVGVGGVTFNIAANYTETISVTLSLTATGTALNPIVFQKDPATTGTNPIIIAHTSGTNTPASASQDGIFRLLGSDYVTINGIDLSDNVANTSNPATMEYGYALYKSGTSNGCQFVTIKNCVITLNNINNVSGSGPMVDGSSGIIVMNALASAAVTSLTPVTGGTNSNNKFYSNTIQNCNTGIALISYASASPYNLSDNNNDIGGNSISTGNTIINFGGAAGSATPAVAIRTLAQYGLNVSYNVINNNNGAFTNHPDVLRGIFINTAASANATISYNTITVKGGGTIQHIYGIENVGGSGPAGNIVDISNNTITGSSYPTATTGGFYGIRNTANPATLTMNSNTVSNNSSAATTTGTFHGLLNTGTATNVTISSNTVSGNTTAALTTGLFAGIYNTGAAATLAINNNLIAGNSTTSLSGLYYAIYNTGAVTSAININANNIGTNILPAFTFNAANSGSQTLISNTSGTTAAALSISNNNIQGITYPSGGTSSSTFIGNTATTRSQAINQNTFTNLNINTSGSVTFIYNSVVVSGTGTQNVNGNAITGNFNKAAGGTITLFSSTATSASGAVVNNNNNNFSNITTVGSTLIAGWVNTDAGAATKTIQNNTFSNWSTGSGSVTAMSTGIVSVNNAITGNLISNITGAGNVTGLSTGSGNDKIYSNTIHNLVSSGATGTIVTGISNTGGTVKNIYLNSIYNLYGNNISSGSVRGIIATGGTTVNIYQNSIYSLQANGLTSGYLSGIWGTTGIINVYRNKVYDLSSSTNVMTSGNINGIQLSGSTSNSAVSIRNNLIGDLRATATNSSDAIRGISLVAAGLTSTIAVYNNTIFLNAVSTGTNFGSSGIYHTTSTTSTTSSLDLRNNIIVNTSVPTGAGLTVAYRRSSATLTNYNTASNYNLFYSGIAATNKLLFFDGTNSDQFLSTYRLRVATRDALSVTEDLVTNNNFLSTTGSSPSFLHLDPSKATQAESGGQSVGAVTIDIDNEPRQGSGGYTGTGTAPDLGADEKEGTRISSFSGTYNVGAGQTFTSLTNADGLFASINSRGLSGNVIINITSDLVEDGTNVIYQWLEEGTGNYSLTIQPDAATMRLISGNVPAGLIRINGADRIIFDGRYAGTGIFLTIRNTNTLGTTGTAFTFLNGATNNNIRYSYIEAFANATNGVILFGSSTVAGGNSNNNISYSNIKATVAGNTGNVCVYSLGTTGRENITNIISNNNIANYRDRGLDIAATGSAGWTIVGNSFFNGDVSALVNFAGGSTLHGIRILGGAGYSLLNNFIGGKGALGAGPNAAYSSTLGSLSFQGILLTTTAATPVSIVRGNTIAGISVSSVPTASGQNLFIGIETNGPGVIIGGSLVGEGNLVGSLTTNGSVSVITSTTSTTFTSVIRGIYSAGSNGLITGNKVGGFDIQNIGTAAASSSFIGIYANNAAGPSVISNNTVGGSAVLNSIRVLSASTATATALTGITLGSSVLSTVTLDGNTVQNMSNLNTSNSTGAVTGISTSAGGTANVTISNNSILSLTSANFIAGSGTPTSSFLVGINNSGSAGTVRVNNNILAGFTTNSTAGNINIIRNSGTIVNVIQINGNQIGSAVSPAITFNAANSGSQIFINNVGGGSASSLSISSNNVQAINYAVAGTGANTYILNSAATLSQAINGNTFTALDVNTAGSVVFISNSVIVQATGTQNVNNNSIITSFTKRAGGTVTLFSSVANSVSGSVINNNNNNFSNITVSGATTIAGWVNTDAGVSLKSISNNVFTNWIGGTSAVTALSVNLTAATNTTTGNQINNFSSAGSITGINSAAGNDNISSNTINKLSTTGISIVTGINITSGGTKSIFKNKIFDLQSLSATGSVYGISVSGGTSVRIYDNLIGDLRTPAASSNTDLIRGISVTSSTANTSVNIYYNTIYLNGTSTGTNFSSSGVYHTGNATGTTATLDLRNNSITNTSVPKGSGFAVAYRRSSTSLANYASLSNNNLFYGGIPSANRLIFYDGTNADQNIASFKTRLAGRDAFSVTEDLTSKFLSTTGSSSVFLHMNTGISSLIESGAAQISGYAEDYDGQIRAGNPGYTGFSSSPDIGADEVFGLEVVPPAISYSLLTNTTSSNNRTFTSVPITDGSGVNSAPGTKPRVYYKRFSDANVYLDNSSSTNGWKYTEAINDASPFDFNIDYSQLYQGGSVTAGVIQYFIVAQDISTTANVGINSGTFNAQPASVALTAAAFPIGGVVNSYSIPFSGTYDIGTSEIFTSLTRADGLFAAINGAGLMGNVTFNIVSDLSENGLNALNQWTESGAGNYRFTLQSDAATGRLISGNAITGLIRLNGADRVTIDGSYSGSGSYLSFKNTNTAGTTGSALSFSAGATNNIIRYSDLQASADGNTGTIYFAPSAVSGGNSHNRIDNCTISSNVGSNIGTVSILSAGTPGNENVSDTISNNIISGFKDLGLDVAATGSSKWTVSGNSFYNGNVTGSLNFPAGSEQYGIRILGGSGYSVIDNHIGGSDSLAGGSKALYSSSLGSLTYHGILLTTTSGLPASSIRGNTVAAIILSSIPVAALTTVFTGIETNGYGIDIGGTNASEGNTIGSSAINGSISITTSTSVSTRTSLVTGINCLSTGGIIANNKISGVDISNIGSSPAPSVFTGIFLNNSLAPSEITENIIGSKITSNSIRILPASTALETSLNGIVVGNAVTTDLLINKNWIGNFGQLSVSSSGSFTGITNNATSGLVTISNDTIQNVLTATNASISSTVYTAIYSTGTSSITSNFIDNISLSATGQNAQIMGIHVTGPVATTISGNLITRLLTTSHKENADAESGSPAESAIVGILNATTDGSQIINNNRFAGFNATSTAGLNIAVTGIGVTSTAAGRIYNNKFGTFINLATGASPSITHLMAAGGSFTVYNNVSSISNLLNTNSLKVYGFVHASTNPWNYYHNTVRVGGSSHGAALRSAAFLLSGTSSPVLKNNIFFNIRTGTGSHYSVSNLGIPPSNWQVGNSDYNNFYSIDSSTVAEWGSGVSKSFSQWQSLTGGDLNSINNAISFITSPYDLEPDSITNCNFNNSGIPITTPVLIDTDIFDVVRNMASPDLGAYEFNYTGFTITSGSNSPVCYGDSLILTVEPGDAIKPSFTWTNPDGILISTDQNPTVVLAPGYFRIRVTDTTGCTENDSILVSVNPRPTATIAAQTSVCDSGFVNLNITVTGSGVINGTLNNGDVFSGYAPLIVVPVFVTGTTDFSISNLSDSLCESTPSDLPDTVTVVVTRSGDWLGINSNWSDAVNWCEGVIPTSSTDVTIPEGTLIMPVISDSAYCRNLIINSGDTLSIAVTGRLHVAGTLTNYGVYNDNGGTEFNGVSGEQNFTGVSTFNNLSINNLNGVKLPAAVIVKSNLVISSGTLSSNNFNIAVRGNWINNATATAFDGGTGTVTFTGSSSQLIGGSFSTRYNNLIIGNTGNTVLLNSDVIITGNLSVNSGTFDIAGHLSNRATAGGVLTVSNNATLKIGSTNTYPVNFSSNVLLVASTIHYSGTNQSVGNQVYGNLRLTGSGGAAVKIFPGSALTIVGNLSAAVGAGTSLIFSAASDIIVNGNISLGDSTTFNGGNYQHNIGGNWINHGTFNGNNGTIVFSGTGTNISGSGAQNFNNLTVAGNGISFSNENISLSGNLATTGGGSFNQASGGTLTMTGPTSVISGTGISLDNLHVNGIVTSSSLFTLTGNLSVNGSLVTDIGPVTMSGAAKTMSGSGSIQFAQLAVTGSVTTTSNFSITSGLNVSGSFSASAGTTTFKAQSSLNGTANLFNIDINGTALQLTSNSQLGIANVFTITSGILDATTFGPNTVNYNGIGAQTVKGLNYSNLILSNSNTKTAGAPVITTYNLTIGAGTTFDPGSYTHSINGNWINNGTFIPAVSTVQFVGPATASITGATTFHILTSNTTNSTTQLILLDDVSADTVNMINGRILTGIKTLTITGTRTGNGIITGKIHRSHSFATGLAYAFESPDNTILFSTVSAVNDVTVSVKPGSVPDFPFSSSISREYEIAVPAGTYTATLRLHYSDDELNGNDESSMTLWNYNGTAWTGVGKSNNNTTSNYIEQDGLTDIAKRWTCSDDANLVQWNGSISTDWNTAGNWTVLQGSGSRPPTSTDVVDLGSGTFLNQPVITNNVTVKNIIFGSSQAVILTIGAGGSLTTTGDISGSWTTNTTHVINVNDQVLTVNGDILLSDDIAGHAINLNIGTGTVTTSGSLHGTGGSIITFSDAGVLNIFEDYHSDNGVFNPGGSTVVYNGTGNQHVAHINYNNVTINKASGIAAIDSAGTISGNLLISAGQLVNSSIISIAGNVTIANGATFQNDNIIYVGGNWNNNGSYTGAGINTIFNGAGAQTISASTFNNLEINKPVGSVATLTGDVVLNGNLLGTSGTLDIKSFFFNRLLVGGSGTLTDSAVLIIGADNAPNMFSSYNLYAGSTIIFNGTQEQHLLLPGVNFGNIILRNNGIKTLLSPIVVNGNLTIESGSTFEGGSNTITLNGSWINAGTFVPSASTVVCNGIGKTIVGNTIFNRLNVPGSYTILNNTTYNGLLNITSTGSLSGGNTIHTLLHGDLINSGTLYTLGTTTFSGNVLQTLSLINAVNTVALIVNFNGSVSPVLNSTSAPQFGYLNINNTGGINPSTGWNILYSLVIGNGASFNGGVSTHNILGSVNNNGAITSSGTLNLVPASPATINFGSNFSSTGTIVFGGAGAMTIAGSPISFNNIVIANSHPSGISPSSVWNATGNFHVNTGSIFKAGIFSYFIGGNILNNGTINPGSSTFTINGGGSQNIYTLSAFHNLTLNKTTGSTTLVINTSVNNTLNFISGNLQTGNNHVTIDINGSVTGAAQNTGWINGRLQKYVATGATAKFFEIGDANNYTPAAVDFSGVTSPGYLTASTTSGDHSALNASSINTSKSVNRFWTIANNGVVFTNYSVVLNFVSADIDAGANTAAFETGLYNGSSWLYPLTSSPNTNNIQADGITVAGDISIGEVCNKGTTIAYAGSPYCSNAGIATVTGTGASGGIFSSTAGLAINTSTGAINLSASSPGSYIITYTIAASAGCSAYITTTNIIINGSPSATFAYTGSPYCTNSGIATAAFSGTTGGIYSSTAGLIIDSATGNIMLAPSSAGTYTITYTIAGSGGCVEYEATTTIVISPLPSASFNYPGSPYCSDAGIIAISHSGTAGGTYSSSPGLSIDAANGSINSGLSIEGTYTVLYTIAAANGCAEFIGSTAITINMVPSASISYPGGPFCNLPNVIAVSLNGTVGGRFSSSPGLSLDTANGDVHTGSSIPGTYVVTYTIDANGGCTAFTTNTSVTINLAGTWTGIVSTDWNDPANWICNLVPGTTSDITIPGNLSNYPVLNGANGSIHNLIIQTGASLMVAYATLQIGGSISNSGIFDAGLGEIEMNGDYLQTIPALQFAGNNIKSLVINNVAGVTLAGVLNITDVLTINSGSIESNGFLILKSTAVATARIAPISSAAATPIVGNVTVERYVIGRRKYRLITSSVTTHANTVLIAGQENYSIWGNWQNQANNVVPYAGTYITGGTSSDGYDTQTGNASLFTYNDVTAKFVAFSSANGKNTRYTPLKAGIAYYMFVYGDRTKSISTSTPNNTVLQSTGTLNTGDQTYNTTSPIPLSGTVNRFTLLGNPFAGPINWTTIPKSDISDTYWGWDPNLNSTGGYITVSNIGAVTLTAPYSGNTGLNQYIQSGQGFFVKTIGTAPSLMIREQDKSTTFNAVAFRAINKRKPEASATTGTEQVLGVNGVVGNVPAEPVVNALLAINLQYTSAGNKVLADGVITVFGSDFTNQPGKEDASKMVNTAENISISNAGNNLSIDARKMPVSNDTIFLNMSGLVKLQYTLQIFADQSGINFMQPWLQDTYLNTLQLVSLNDTNNIVININPAIPATAAANRFRIVFYAPGLILPAKLIKVHGLRVGKDIRVDWKLSPRQESGYYRIERSNNGRDFVTVANVSALTANREGDYQWLDKEVVAGRLYYRVRAIDEDGKNLLSEIILVDINSNNSLIKVFPNPVTNKRLNVSADLLEKGIYTLELTNSLGAVMIHQMIDHPGGVFRQNIHLQKIPFAGIYYLRMSSVNINFMQPVMIE